ncbi:PHD_2 domain-containing protein/zf-HC5HC2H_2 domain-containing protein [Cephalotus follicularis]|uniref:PHD_2 domain-containing protein/zf-HC5HC2H_2 domain-containing protein n=1 Tax=Cephalotus follicularis TaxID=3775 RepID=A0A1Q3AUH5_CEPFO|nr:PHD_2 domain-containing protein/zf-HC5HC2H_2 domain-containing protein [Cephalotus follicularis]
MNGGEDRCHQRQKMMGRGADGGCGTEERPCRPIIPRIPPKIQDDDGITKTLQPSLDIDIFSQARKSLCERSPFDTPEDGNGGDNGNVNNLSVVTLPSGLANLLKQSDSRKRHKKSHFGANKKSSRQAKGGSIWVETEEYFRNLALPDINNLFELSDLSNLPAEKCYSIPFPKNGDELGAHVKSETKESVCCICEKVSVNDGDVNGVVVEEQVKEERNEEFMEIDSTGADSLSQEEKGCFVSDSVNGLEWILGSRRRALLTSERPSKKRKLLGSDAGLERVLIGCPCDGDCSLCHYCCKGDFGIESNRLIFCNSCKVAVHQKCYGVQEGVDGSWLCSWCKVKHDSSDSVKQPCVFCPKQGGALKPVHKSDGNGGSVEFAHLFCSMLIPEVYIEDLVKMEPIINVQGIKETRRKLICNVCKVKCGACVRCSHGTCRTSFHPICAREARHKVEVWGKYGCDNIELRAFCSKHSDHDSSQTPRSGDPCVAVDGDSSFASTVPTMLLINRSHKLKIGRRNGDKIDFNIDSPDTNSDKSSESELQEMGLSDSGLKARVMSDCGDGPQLASMGMLERSNCEEVNPSEFLKFLPILKKLIDRGKVNAKDVALEIGVLPDSLNAILADGSMAPDLQCKIVKWLKTHAYMSTSQKNLKVKIKSTVSSQAERGAADCSDGVTVSESDISDPVAVKSVPPRRRTISKVRILRDNQVKCSSEEIFSDSGTVMDEVKVNELVRGEVDDSSKASIPDATEKKSTMPESFQDCLVRDPLKSEGSSAKHSTCSISERGQLEEADLPQQNTAGDADPRSSESASENPIVPDLIKSEALSSVYIHPYIKKKLAQMQNSAHLTNRANESDEKNNTKLEFVGTREVETSCLETSSNASVCCDHLSHLGKCKDMICKYGGVDLKQLAEARKMGVLELSPQDEVEGEIIYFQDRLLSNAVTRKQLTDNLVCKVAQTLPQEIDAARSQRWDAVLVNQYLCELREAKKQGRKERRHKEAQAVLAAATAAAAASSRISSVRKDTFEDSPHQENLLRLNSSNGAGISSQLMPRPKETLSRVAVPRVSSQKYSDFVQSVSDFSKEHPRSCDVCRRSETILNPILVCSSCKVAVHLDCYRSVKGPPGPWYCELCEELLSSRSAGVTSVNFWEKPYFVAECGLCGGTTGAFRKSSDGQWVHAFCAEWVFESTFRRGQVNPVQGMETASKEVDSCCICRRKHGICIKCFYGHCQTTFHPSCARSAGFYMNVKVNVGKLQHKAYCEKHSFEQRAKAETQKHGVEELKSIKQIRVELERLRLLCERIIKREKIKRELVLCSHGVLACKRDHVARSLLIHSPLFPPDVSSDSATTSLKGHTDGNKSCSETIQRSDDMTVDSIVSVKHRVKVPVTMDTDQKTDDSSTSQNLFTLKPTERMPFSGKQIPHRPSVAPCNLLDDGEWSSRSRKHIETFKKELVMTSDQASMKNQRLPKGYAYVPKDCLSKEKHINQDACSGEPMENDG